MKHITLAAGCLMAMACGTISNQDEVKTTFQTARGWSASIDNRADAVMLYGVGRNLADSMCGQTPIEDRLRSWRDRGYKTHFMTGIAWGSYQDYFTGRWDGKWHLDEGQVTMKGDTIWHGHMVPYIVPTENYLKYFKERHIKRVIDAGVDAIFLEEPEFWASAGYSEAFKREWQEYYGTPWRPQDESPEATYMSGKLKYHLYYRALEDAFTYAKEYGKSKGMDVKCYVPTHSLLNYSQWQIVSPEASLASLPCVDGYIAQVWTGTSRAEDYYNGIYGERVFETAFLEYGCMRSMTGPTGRKVWFLTDPIEDWPRDWADYKKNYQATFTAQMFYPAIADYEIMPWPERIYEGIYNTGPGSGEKTRIPRDYSTMMQIMINAAHEVPATEGRVSGSPGISVLMGNSLMFQRFPEHDGYSDPQLSNFYGLAMPLLKKGVPVNITHMENLSFRKALSDTKLLLMSYSNMKPLDPAAHKYLAAWVKKGGVLLYSGRDDDPFQGVSEWWNTNGNNFAAPSDHLFSLVDIPAGAHEGIYKYGKGKVCILRQDPKEYVLIAGGDAPLLKAVESLYDMIEYKNNFVLERGPYTIVAVMDESVNNDSYTLTGKYVDLYDPRLPIYTSKEIKPGTQGFFFNLSKAGKAPGIIAGAGRAYNEEKTRTSYSFVVKSPINTTNVSRLLIPSKPVSVKISGQDADCNWDALSSTCLIVFENDPDGVTIEVNW